MKEPPLEDMIPIARKIIKEEMKQDIHKMQSEVQDNAGVHHLHEGHHGER